MATIITDSLQLDAALSLDNKYLKNGSAPYSSISDVNTTIVSAYRSQGLTVLIGDLEYWYRDGIADADLVIKTQGVVSAPEWGVKYDGTDQTAIINSILATSYVNTLVFDNILARDITVSGTINAGNKKLSFRNQNRIVGTNNIVSALFDAALTDQCITKGSTLFDCSSVRTEFSCENFGAAGNGSDETDILQATSDMLIANPRMPRTIKMFSGKTYATMGWIWYNWNGSDYDQFQLSLLGEPNAFTGNPSFFPTIKCLNIDGFGLGVQRSTGFTIRGVGFQGLLDIPSVTSEAEFYSRSYAGFAYPARDTQYSPNALIVIDPFTNTSTIPTDGGYPGYTSWYRGSGSGYHAGSTAGVIEDVSLNGATVGILVSPNGETQQAENMVFSRIFGNNCKAVFGFCQRESKNCFVNGGYSIDRVHTIVDGVTWGAQQGTLPNFNGYNQSGYVVQFIQAITQHTVSFKDLYLENLFRIGDLIASPPGRAEFTGCTVYFNSTAPVLVPQSHLGMFYAINREGGCVKFDTCTLRYYDDLFNKRAAFAGQGYVFDNCFFDLPPMTVSGDVLGSTRSNDITIINSYFGPGGAYFIGWENLKGLNYTGYIPYKQIRQENNYDVITDNVAKIINDLNAGDYQVVRQLGYGASFTVDAVNRTAVLAAGYLDVAIGEYIAVYTTDYSSFYTLGRVTAVNNTTYDIDIADVPLGVPGGTQPTPLFLMRDYKRVKGRFTGVYTYGSNVITNVFGSPSVGELDYFTGRKILSVGAGTATLSTVAIFSSTGEIYSPPVTTADFTVTYELPSLPTDSANSSNTIAFFPGDRWVAKPFYSSYSPTLSTMRTFVCVTSGYLFPASIGQTKQAAWVEVFETSNNVRTVTGTDTAFPQDDILLADTSGGNVTVNLYAFFANKTFSIKKVTNDANTVTVFGVSGTIDGASSFTLTAYNQSVRIASNGTNFYIL